MYLYHYLKILELPAPASVTDKGIHKKFSNQEMEDIMGIVKFLEEYSLLIMKGASETIGNEVKGQKGEFRAIFLGVLGVGLLGTVSR